MNIINDLKELALATRMMRVAEQTRKDVSRIYKEHELEFESKWFPVLIVLSKKPGIGVVELADEIGYTHQSVIALVKEMQKHKLIKSTSSKTDGRKKLLSLTSKSMDMIEKFQPLWADFMEINKAIYHNGSNLLKAIEDTESALEQESFYDRYKKLKAKRLNS